MFGPMPILTVTKGFWRNGTNVGEYSEEFTCRARMWVTRKWFGCLFSHYANLTLTQIVGATDKSHASCRGVCGTSMHELRRYVFRNVGKVGNWRWSFWCRRGWRRQVRGDWSCNGDSHSTGGSSGVFDDFEI